MNIYKYLLLLLGVWKMGRSEFFGCGGDGLWVC